MGADKKCILEKNMSKIINAETAIDEIKKTIDEIEKNGGRHASFVRANGDMIISGLGIALNILQASPPITCCENCKHGVHSGRGDTYYCVVSPEELGIHKYDFWCAYGEEKI